MEDQKQTRFTFEIDNFSEKEASISSQKFSSGGCEWFVRVHPKGDMFDDHLALYLLVANPQSLRLGWKRRASYSFFLVNQLGKDLIKINDTTCRLFCAQMSGWGRSKAVPLKKLQEKGFLEKNKLIVKVEVKVVEVVDQGDVTGKETFDYGGFQVLYSQATSLSKLFANHPNVAVNVRQKNQRVKTTYMNILLDLIETLDKPPHSISETELSNTRSELIDLTEAGFKLDFLKTKLEEVSLERKKTNAADDDGSRVQELEKQIKNLKAELNEEKVKSVSSDAKVLLFEQTVSDLKDVVTGLKDEMSDLKDVVKDLKDELNKNEAKSDTSAANGFSLLKQTVSDLKDEMLELNGGVSNEMSDVKDDLSELKDGVLVLKDGLLNLIRKLNKEKDKSDTCAAKVLSLEQTVLDLKDELKKNESYLKDELNKNEARSDTCDAKVLSLEQMVLNLRADLNKDKGVVCPWEVLDYEK
ncbi:unnamed protein product [Microthlaspi erraticum]|uniref:MATH domain-containing protein n=1 Tax=Microthlaspi erraticum TaxID=1685480 RepID=A0A6D2IQK2_9BRAS|nr:unnamed protein product [Microthlaspi erraticum]CAA7032732.1 unnamed protein product [Microthlaspi erraticum]